MTKKTDTSNEVNFTHNNYVTPQEITLNLTGLHITGDMNILGTFRVSFSNSKQKTCL